MEKNHEACYAAFKSKDTRFDGRFFVGVKSTGIYCRPVCRARLPKPENCIFFATAAEAERAGFRPCLQCRPELAPGQAPVDASKSLARRAARLLEENCAEFESLEDMASHLGCTGRHLRRVFYEEYRVSPVEYLQTCRLLLAKSLLTDTGLSVLDAAMASGFGSLRRFNELFKKQYRLTPAALRRQAAQGKAEISNTVTVSLGLRPPYGWDSLLSFLSQRAVPGVEAVRDGAYYRTVSLNARSRGEVRGFIKVESREKQNALGVTVSASLLPALPQVLSRVRDQFDLFCAPDVVSETLLAMNELKEGLFVPGIRLPGCFEPFEMCVRTVLGQQITVKAATTLAGRMAQSLGEPVQTGIDGLTRIFPTAKAVLALGDPISDSLGPLGILSARANTIRALAAALEEKTILLEPGANPEETIEKLLDLPGIGPWTAQYIAMRALGYTDAFPETDYGIKKALAPRTRKEILTLAENWRPWRGYAAMSLWNTL